MEYTEQPPTFAGNICHTMPMKPRETEGFPLDDYENQE